MAEPLPPKDGDRQRGPRPSKPTPAPKTPDIDMDWLRPAPDWPPTRFDTVQRPTSDEPSFSTQATREMEPAQGFGASLMMKSRQIIRKSAELTHGVSRATEAFLRRSIERLRTLGCWLLCESRETAAATWGQAVRLGSAVNGCWQGFVLARTARSAKLALGERLSHAGLGNAALRERIRAIDDQVSRFEPPRKVSNALRAERQALIDQLATAALHLSMPPAGAQAEHIRARNSQILLEIHKKKMSAIWACLLPRGAAGWRRTMSGYGVIVLFLAGAAGLLLQKASDKRSTTTQLVQASPDRPQKDMAKSMGRPEMVASPKKDAVRSDPALIQADGRPKEQAAKRLASLTAPTPKEGSAESQLAHPKVPLTEPTAGTSGERRVSLSEQRTSSLKVDIAPASSAVEKIAGSPEVPAAKAESQVEQPATTKTEPIKSQPAAKPDYSPPWARQAKKSAPPPEKPTIAPETAVESSGPGPVQTAQPADKAIPVAKAPAVEYLPDLSDAPKNTEPKAEQAPAVPPLAPPGDKPSLEPAVQAEMANLQGAWSALAVEFDGQRVPDQELEAFQAIITDDQLRITLGEEGQEQVRLAIDPTVVPRIMDLHPTEGPDKGKTWPAIYLLDGHILTICMDDHGNYQRPAQFGTAPKSGQTMLVLKRKPQP